MLNKVMLIGYLGDDPELKYTPSNKAVANFSMATSERWKDAQGNQKEKTEWHRLVAWGDTAENAAKYLKKGHRVYLEGSIGTQQWTDKQGATRYTTQITVRLIKFLEKKEQNGSNQPQSKPNPPATAAPEGPPIPDDGDIPF